MKFICQALILVTVFIAYCCTKQRNDLPLQEVSGNVKSIRTTGYTTIEKFGEIMEGNALFGNSLVKFNKDGYITEISFFDNHGVLTKKSIYALDENNKVTTINRYDGDGVEVGKTVYTYDENLNATMIVDYDENGKAKSTQKNEWEDGKCIKSLFKNNCSDEYYVMNEFEGNKLTKSVVYDKNGKETGEYTEFEDDKMTKIVNSDFTVSISYNDKGLCTSIVNGQLSNTNSYLLVKGESYKYEYEYDERGNWIRKTEKEGNAQIACRIFVRKIEYY